jgi:hypothetical protein
MGIRLSFCKTSEFRGEGVKPPTPPFGTPLNDSFRPQTGKQNWPTWSRTVEGTGTYKYVRSLSTRTRTQQLEHDGCQVGSSAARSAQPAETMEITFVIHGARRKCYSTLREKAEKEDNIKISIIWVDCKRICWLRINPIRNSVVPVMPACKGKRLLTDF